MAIFNGTNLVPDTIVGTAESDEIYGYDSLSGSLGGVTDGDFLYGGDGVDVLNGGDGDDTLYGGDGDDFIDGGGGINSLYGGTGDDRLAGGDGADTIYGGSDGDFISGGAGDDWIDAGAGQDFVAWAPGSVDWLDGGADGDMLTIDASSDTIDYTYDFSDLSSAIVLPDGTTFVNFELINFSGGSGNDTIISSLFQNNTFLIGNAGNDTLTGYDCDGGAGDDNIFIGIPGALDITMPGTGFGGSGNDTLTGGVGNDWLVGEAGDDQIISLNAQDGTDFYDGREGINTLNYSAFGAANGITAGLYGSFRVTVSVFGGHSDQVANFANVAGGAGNDVIVGDFLSNILVGNGGSDYLYGYGEADALDGGNGDDFLFIDHFDTTVQGGAGYDAVFVYDATGTSLDLGAAHTEWIYAWTGNDTLNAASSAVGVALVGESGTDVLTGSAFNDYVYFDSLDTVDAGAGYDALFVYVGNGQTVTDTTIDVAATHSEWVLGGAGNDTIFNTGSTSSVALSGGAGDDRITGGLGSDYLYGNTGADTFVITSNAQYDYVLDFENGVDLIDVGAMGLTNFAQIQGIATEASGSVTLDFGGGNRLLIYNVGLSQLNAADFIF